MQRVLAIDSFQIFYSKAENSSLLLTSHLSNTLGLYHFSAPMPRSTHLTTNSKWAQNAVTVAGGNGRGNALNQLDHPRGMFVDADRTVYIADSGNGRILTWRQNETTGQVVAGGNGAGNRGDRLGWPNYVIIDHRIDSLLVSDGKNRRVIRWPRLNPTGQKTIITNIDCCGLAMDDDGALYVADYERHEVRRYRNGEAQGTIVAGGNGSGNHLNQLCRPSYVFVDRDRSLYVSDGLNHRVMKWLKDANEGILVAGGHGEGNSLKQLSNPYGIFVGEVGSVYVADFSNHRIMRWGKNATEGTVIVGGNRQGNQASQLSYPTGLSVDLEGRLYVVEYGNSRVQRFDIDQS